MKPGPDIRTAIMVLMASALVGCSELAYYHQAVEGHLQIVGKQRPVDVLLASRDTRPELSDRLRLSEELRDYAVTDLALPDNESYRSYVELDRPFAVWSVFAAPELSMQPATWCYPFVGCLAYRGYFDQQAAQALAAELREEGQEVWIGGVPAYSSLGWSQDPLLSTFIGWSDGRLAELVFHELAHQKIYVSGDTAFNEAFATAVGQHGAERWLQSRGDADQLAAYRRLRARRRSFLELTGQYRAALQAIYSSARDDDEAKRRAKADALRELAEDYGHWKFRHGGYSGYDRLIAPGPNNAWFAAMATYHELVPAFDRLLADSGDEFPLFYAEVERLAALQKEVRQGYLEALRTAADVSN